MPWRTRDGGNTSVSRVKRLAVPLVFGIFVIIAPWQVYLERVSHGQYSGSFWSFVPALLRRLVRSGGNFAWMGVHLWYLEFLFVFSVITLPLFLILRSRAGVRLIAALSATMKVPGAIFLLAIPIAIMEFIANSPALKRKASSASADFGGWSLLPYLAIFIVGFVLAGAEGWRKAMEKPSFRWASRRHPDVRPRLLPGQEAGLAEDSVGFALLRGLLCWAWLVAIGGFASRHLRFSNSFLKYANEAVLPFYILHQTVILTIGFYVLRLDIRLWIEYLIIAPVPSSSHGPVRVAHPPDQHPAFPLRHEAARRPQPAPAPQLSPFA